jgi:putative hydrolase of the HAD superfamily
MPPRAILLDALGTLVALEPPAAPLARLVGERHGVEVTPADATRALRAEMAHYRSNCIHAADAASLAALRLECAALVGRELGGTLAALDAAELVPTLLDSIRFHPYPEVPAALARLRGEGFALVVASNWDVSLHDVLERTGLDLLLDGVVTSAEVGAAKPDARLFAAALAVAGVGAAEALHVGDSLEEDFEGALRAGLDAAWLDREGVSDVPPGARVIASLDELP